jgi:beta-galactosidase/beta-glucuronidase
MTTILKGKKLPYLLLALMPLLLMASVSGAATYSIPLDTGWRFSFAGNDSGLGPANSPGSRGSEPVTIPHLFPGTGKGGSPAAGFGWYTRDIDVPPAFSGADVALEFEGVCLFARVFIDGIPAASGDYPYLPFTVDCTPFLSGKNSIRVAIRVDDRLIPGRIPDDKALGWWVYGGICRPVRLVARSRDRIGRADLRTLFRGGDTFDLTVHAVAAHDKWDSVRLTVTPPDRRPAAIMATLRGNDTALRLHGVQPWTPESPSRYTVTLVPFFHGRQGDTLSILRGFSQLTAVRSRLFLNGKPYYLRGMGRHDVLGDRGPRLTREERCADLVDLKALGVNFLRIAHFPQDRDVYELCDSLGLLVMDEIPAWKTSGDFLASGPGKACGSGYMRSLIEAHGNYTGICIWSVGNQLPTYRTAAAGFVKAVAAAAKGADPSRLVTCCSYWYQLDRAFPYVDVIAVNEYFGWELASLPLLGPMLGGIHAKWPDKPMLVSEFGAQSAYGFRNPHPKLAGIVRSMLSKDLSEDHQALFLGSHMDSIWARRSFVNGMVIWAYADYRSNLNKARTGTMPVGLNGCGMVTEDRKRKVAYGVVQGRYKAFEGVAPLMDR